jgi:hypothetical protein
MGFELLDLYLDFFFAWIYGVVEVFGAFSLADAGEAFVVGGW